MAAAWGRSELNRNADRRGTRDVWPRHGWARDSMNRPEAAFRRTATGVSLSLDGLAIHADYATCNQYGTRVVVSVEWRGQPCQKQPSTKTATSAPRCTTSGRPGTFLGWQR